MIWRHPTQDARIRFSQQDGLTHALLLAGDSERIATGKGTDPLDAFQDLREICKGTDGGRLAEEIFAGDLKGE